MSESNTRRPDEPFEDEGPFEPFCAWSKREPGAVRRIPPVQPAPGISIDGDRTILDPEKVFVRLGSVEVSLAQALGLPPQP